MRASSITLLLATGLWAVAACGSGGGDGPTGQPAPLQNGSYQKPFSSYQPAPSTPAPSDYEKPPSVYDDGHSDTPTSPGGGELCRPFCDLSQQNECPADPDSEGDLIGLPYDECMQVCTDATVGLPCAVELDTLFACIYGYPELSCSDLNNLEEGDVDDLDDDITDPCIGAAKPLVNCLTHRDPPDPGEGGSGSCTLPLCGGCVDACQTCRCNNLGSDASCPECRDENNR